MGNILRAEARPAAWNELLDTQQLAVGGVIRSLAAAVADLPSPNGGGVTLNSLDIDAGRSSRTSFVLGGRGTGKTSVFLTLKRVAGRVASAPDYPGSVTRNLAAIYRRIVWLPTLDMELVGPASNPLAAIATRIEAAYQQCGAFGGEATRATGPRGLLDFPEVSPLQHLRRLRANIAIAWHYGQTSPTRGQDWDNLAADDIRGEQAGQSLVENFGEVLEELAVEMQRSGQVQNPLFVLPIDDFDLNPRACVDVLRVLRMLSLPRLLFLVLGDLDVANVVFQLKVANELSALAGASATSPMMPLRPDRVGELASEIAANALRKLIPLAHQYIVYLPTLAESLNFRPLHGRDDETEGDKVPPPNDDVYQARLFELMKKFRVTTEFGTVAPPDNSTLPESLYDYLLSPGASLFASSEERTPHDERNRLQREELSRAFYSARHLFVAPMRRILDFWHGLARRVEFQQLREPHGVPSKKTRGRSHPEPLSDQARRELSESNAASRWFFSQYCASSVAEEPALSTNQRAALLDALNPRGSDDWNLNSIPVQVTPEVLPLVEYVATIPRRLIAPRHVTKEGEPDVAFCFGQQVGWRVTVAGRASGSGTSPQPRDCELPRFSQAVAASIILFHDRVVDGPWAPSRGSLIASSEDSTWRWAVTAWRSETVGQQEVAFTWQPPHLVTFRTMDRFLFSWNDFLTRLHVRGVHPPQIACAAMAWSLAGTMAIDWYRDPTLSVWNEIASKFKASFDSSSPLPWKDLLKGLETILPYAHENSHHANVRREWLIRVASLILLPEYGICVDPSLIQSQMVELQWTRERQGIAARRRQRFEQLEAAGLTELVRLFRAYDKKHLYEGAFLPK